jgi:hypothetical protein
MSELPELLLHLGGWRVRCSRWFYADHGTPFFERADLTDDTWDLALKYPDENILGLFADNRCNDTRNTAKFRVDAKYSSCAADAENGAKGLLADNVNGELDKAAFAGGRNEAELEWAILRRGIQQHRGSEAVAKVGGKIDVTRFYLFLAVFLGGADGDVPVLFDKGIRGFGEEWALLNVLVANQVEGFALGEHRRVLIDGTVPEVVRETGVYDGTPGCLKELAVAQYGAGLATEKRKGVAHALGTMDGNCLRLLREGNGSGGANNCRGKVGFYPGAENVTYIHWAPHLHMGVAHSRRTSCRRERTVSVI